MEVVTRYASNDGEVTKESAKATLIFESGWGFRGLPMDRTNGRAHTHTHTFVRNQGPTKVMATRRPVNGTGVRMGSVPGDRKRLAGALGMVVNVCGYACVKRRSHSEGIVVGPIMGSMSYADTLILLPADSVAAGDASRGVSSSCASSSCSSWQASVRCTT